MKIIVCKKQCFKKTWTPLLTLCFPEGDMFFVYEITHSKGMSLFD